MVIKHAEEKYHDIHTNYRDLANQLHDSWKNKYNKLEAENNRLMDTLTNLVKQNKTDKLIEVDGQSNDSENEHDVTSPISHIPIKNIAESLDLNDDELNQLTGGINNTDNNDNNNNNNGNTVKNKDNESGNDKEKKSKTKKRVIEAYID